MDLCAARKQLGELLVTLKSGTLLIEGPTLIGKTVLIKDLETDLRQRGLAEVFIDTISCSESHAGYEPILDSVEKLSKRENWALTKRSARVAKAIALHSLTAVGGVFRKFFPDAIPKDVLESLRNGLDAIINEKNEASGSREFPRSEKSKLANVLRDVIEQSGRRLVLFVDRLDDLPTPGIKLLQFIAETTPANVVLVLCANSESSAYSDRQDIRELANTCKKNGEGAIWKIDGYSAVSLLEIRRNNGYPTTLEAAEQAFEFSLGGRIGLVSPWLNSANDGISYLQSAADRLAAHYAIQYDRLGEQHQNVVKCLAAVYPAGLPLPHLASLLDCSVADLDDRLRKLQSFTEISNNTVTLKNKHVQYFTRTSLQRPFVQAAYEALQSRISLGVSDLNASTPKLPAPPLPQCFPAIESSAVLKDARDLLARGASKAAITYLETWRGWADSAAEDLDVNAEVFLLEADAYGQLGAYRPAIDLLERMPPVASFSIAKSLSLGEKYYRVGLHREALENLSRARKESRRCGQPDAWAKAVSRTLSVRNELSSGRCSKLLADCLARALRSDLTSIKPRTQSLAYRALARTYALRGSSQSTALECANEALRIAIQEESPSDRDEGNARYSLADVYRHSGQIDDALREYELALTKADRTDNYDLRLYAMLGKAACFLKTCDRGRLSLVLSALDKLVTAEHESPEYKIVGLFKRVEQRLSGNICQNANSDSVLAVAGRPWTLELQKCIADRATDFKISLRKLVVVL